MCPVSGGLALAALTTAAGTAATAAGATTLVAAGTAAVATSFASAAVAAIGAAAIGAAIGVGIGGVVNLATGRGFFDGAGKAALFGAIGGGASSALNSGALAAQAASATAESAALAAGTSTQASNTVFNASQYVIEATGSTTNFVTSTGLTAVGSALTPEPFGAVIPQASQQDFSGGQIRTTGSGGSQAAVSLAEAVTRSKQRKLSQADVSSLSVDTSSFASGGLQFA